MKRLTFYEPDGRFGVAGMNEENQNKKVYMCIVKLKHYEDTGLNPDDVDNLKYQLEDYKNTGLTPKEIMEINDFATSQCGKLLAENGRLKRLLNEINNKAVDFQESGPFSQDEALARVMKIYKLSMLKNDS